MSWSKSALAASLKARWKKTAEKRKAAKEQRRVKQPKQAEQQQG